MGKMSGSALIGGSIQLRQDQKRFLREVYWRDARGR